MSWPLGAVSDIAEIISGYAFKSEWFGSGFDKVIRIGDLQDGRVQLDSALCVDAKINNVSSQFKIRPKDILMALSGATVGKIAIAQERDAGAYINQRVAIIRGKTPEAAEFLKYVFSGALQEKLLLSAGGAAQPNLSTKSLALMEIPLPPLAEQKRIAAILDKADAIRRKRQQAIKLADEFLRSVFLDMFGDPVTNPKGWEVRKVGDVVDCIVPGRDKPKSFTGKIPWVTTHDLLHLKTTHQSKSSIGLTDTEVKEVKAKIVPTGSVIMTCVGDLGVISIASNDFVINQQLHAFLPSIEVNNYFLMYALSFQKNFMLAMASSTTLPYMNKTICNSVPVILPSIAKQNEFGKVCQTVVKKRDIAELSMKNYCLLI